MFVFRFSEDQSEVDNVAKADVILTTSLNELRRLYCEDKFFGMLATEYKEIPKKQPKNVFVLDGGDLIHGENGAVAFKRAYDNWVNRAKEAQPATASFNITDIEKFDHSYAVLIVDDSKENLAIAMHVLVGQQICPVQSLEDALKLLRLEGKTFDVVLTDMHMPPDKTYQSLSVDYYYGIGETVPYGFAVMLEATQRGIPVAIVTDANHHKDWVSAMFDHMHRATVNGQKVLFLNNIGKRWDTALKMLLEQ